MINQQVLQGSWNEIRGKLRTKWGQLTDDDLTVFNGDVEQLVGTIQRKTGEARETIERYFEQFGSEGAAAIGRATEAGRVYAHQAAEAVQASSQRAAASVREGYAEVEDLVHKRPVASLAVTFGVGLLAGVAATLYLLRWR